jgi:hypothetical protein
MEKSQAWWCAPVIPATAGNIKKRRISVQAGLHKKQDLISKNNEDKKG